MNEKREKLIILSNDVKFLMETGELDTISVNAGIVELYKKKEPKINDFKKFKDWVKEGYKIIKGSKSYQVWGSPLKAKQKDKKNADVKTDNDDNKKKEEYKLFPICNLFSNLQVEKI